MAVLTFVRNTNEHRLVIVEDDDSYRICGMTGMMGKKHKDFKKYYRHCIDNGWRKVKLADYLAVKHKVLKS